MDKIKIYRSSVLGDETTNPVEVKELPLHEAEVAARITLLSNLIEQVQNEIERAKDEIKSLEAAVSITTLQIPLHFPMTFGTVPYVVLIEDNYEKPI